MAQYTVLRTAFALSLVAAQAYAASEDYPQTGGAWTQRVTSMEMVPSIGSEAAVQSRNGLPHRFAQVAEIYDQARTPTEMAPSLGSEATVQSISSLPPGFTQDRLAYARAPASQRFTALLPTHHRDLTKAE